MVYIRADPRGSIFYAAFFAAKCIKALRLRSGKG